MNFKILKEIVEYTQEKKGGHEISFSIVSNLTLLTDEHIGFFRDHNISVSTSIDGPAQLHDINRPKPDCVQGSFHQTVSALQKLRYNGIEGGAIQTTTRQSLGYAKEIVYLYRTIGLTSVFLRPLTPLGKASARWNEIGYTPSEFLGFYEQALREIIEVNKEGYQLKEAHAGILMKKICGEGVNYMELRSPCGAGYGQLAYFADGNIFTCDEGRMFYEMGDDSFKLGNVNKDSFESITSCSTCKTVCKASVLECLPSCADCIWQPYCGVCPVVNYAKTQDLIEKEPNGYKCQIFSGMLRIIFGIIKNGTQLEKEILMSWAS